MYGNWLYMETPDGNLVCLNASDGKERWKVRITDAKLDYTTTAVPIVIGNHILVGVAETISITPASSNPSIPKPALHSGRRTPHRAKANPASKPGPMIRRRARHRTNLDPRLLRSRPQSLLPRHRQSQSRDGEQSRKGDNLFTFSILAINPDTGKIVWYYQATPHDTHDWDSTESVIMIDGTIDGKPRKLVAQANRNGYFYVSTAPTANTSSPRP